MKLRKILSEISLQFQNDNDDYSHGQSDNSLKAFLGNKLVGIINYSEYENEPSVKMLEVKPEFRRQGIGTKLLQQLQKLYPNTEIDLGYASKEGDALLKTIKRKFIPNKKYTQLIAKLEKYKEDKNRIMKKSESGDYSENHLLNDLHDSIYDLEDQLHNLKPGKWIIQ